MNSQIEQRDKCPKFAWIILLVLGCVDLFRGVLHTIFLRFAAENIMGLNLAAEADNQLLLMGTFGISNYITGIVWILIAFKARNIVQWILLVIPGSYALGTIFIRFVYGVESSSKLGGLPMMIGYMIVCIGTFIAILIWKKIKETKTKQDIN